PKPASDAVHACLSARAAARSTARRAALRLASLHAGLHASSARPRPARACRRCRPRSPRARRCRGPYASTAARSSSFPLPLDVAVGQLALLLVAIPRLHERRAEGALVELAWPCRE